MDFALSRWTYQEFFSRYRVLMKQKDVLPDKKLTCKNVLEKLVRVSQTFFSLFFPPSVHFSSRFCLYFFFSDPCLHWGLFFFGVFRIRISTSLVRPRSSSGLARWPT